MTRYLVIPSRGESHLVDAIFRSKKKEGKGKRENEKEENRKKLSEKKRGKRKKSEGKKRKRKNKILIEERKKLIRKIVKQT